MSLTLLALPYHMGTRGTGVGGGPERILASRVAVEPGSPHVRVDLGQHAPYPQVNEALAVEVRQARGAGSLPVILAGNCDSCLGTLDAIAESGGPVYVHIDIDAIDKAHSPRVMRTIADVTSSTEGRSKAAAHRT